MALKLTGSDAPLRGMLAALKAFGQGAVVREAAKKLAPVLQELGDRPWQRRADPDGAPWAPRKRTYPHSLLEKTGKTRRSLRSRASGTSVITTVSTPFARFHQTGTRKMAARPLFPAQQALPPVWAARVRKTITDHIASVTGGKK